MIIILAMANYRRASLPQLIAMQRRVLAEMMIEVFGPRQLDLVIEIASPEEIVSDLALGEDQHHEFKRMIDNPESVAGEVVVFALHYDESPVLGTSLADLSIAAFSAYHQHHFGL